MGFSQLEGEVTDEEEARMIHVVMDQTWSHHELIQLNIVVMVTYRSIYRYMYLRC